MAKNWTAAEAAQVVVKGTDKAAIQDIGRRFPLFVSAAARGVEGLLEIIGSLPDHQTARKIEAALKEGVEDFEEEEEAEKPAKKEKAAKPAKEEKKGKKAKAADLEDEDEDEEEDEKPAKKSKKEKPAKEDKKGKGKKKPEPEPEEDEDDEDEDGDGYEDMSLAELKKEAKKQKLNIKGMDKEEIIAALRGEEPDDDEDEDDEDDWDL